MKIAGLLMVGLAFVAFGLAQQQTPFGPLTPLSSDKFSIAPDIPTNTDFYCGVRFYKPFCTMFNDLVALNDPKVDAILLKLPAFQLTNASGAIIFPRTP